MISVSTSSIASIPNSSHHPTSTQTPALSPTTRKPTILLPQPHSQATPNISSNQSYPILIPSTIRTTTITSQPAAVPSTTATPPVGGRSFSYTRDFLPTLGNYSRPSTHPTQQAIAPYPREIITVNQRETDPTTQHDSSVRKGEKHVTRESALLSHDSHGRSSSVWGTDVNVGDSDGGPSNEMSLDAKRKLNRRRRPPASNPFLNQFTDRKCLIEPTAPLRLITDFCTQMDYIELGDPENIDALDLHSASYLYEVYFILFI
jgi:hypothetical protein